MTREEAIEIVKTQYPHDHVMKTALGLLIPELRESEDERIRKEIIEHIKDQIHSFISPPDCRDKHEEEELARYKSWIGWLEKQKEQRPAESSNDGVIQKTYKEGVNDGIALVKKQPEDYGLQKPAEWSEEDENKIKDIIDYLECWNDFDHGSESFEEYRKRMEGNIQFMKSLRPSWKPSEEQMRCLCEVVDEAIRKHNLSIGGYPRAKILESLYKQLQKL